MRSSRFFGLARRFAVLGVFGALTGTGSASVARAMVAVSRLRSELRTAAEAAARCPGVIEGRHVVRIAIASDGHPAEVELVEAPNPTDASARACIEQSFRAMRHPSWTPRPDSRARLVVMFPFVVLNGSTQP